jgi:Xaa-Pro aminopeptidase
MLPGLRAAIISRFKKTGACIMADKNQRGEKTMLPFTTQEFVRRHRKIREIMQFRGIDCLIITGNTGGNQSLAADIRYVAGLPGSAAEGTYILFPLMGKPVFLAPSIFVADRIGKKCSIPVAPVAFKKGTRIRDYGSDLVNRIKDLGLEKGTIGVVSMRVMPAGTYLNLQRDLPNANWVSAGDILLECRLVKSPEELEFVRKAGECADRGMQAILKAARPGVTEAELTARCDYAMIRAGADRGPFILIGSNPWEKFQGAIGDASQSPRKLQKGDIVLTELSPSYGGYYAQLCVPISIGGSPSRAFSELLKIDKEIYQLALEELRPGATVGEIETKVFRLAARRGSFRRAWALQSTELAEAFFKFDSEIKEHMSYVIHPWTEFASGKGIQGHTIGNTVIVTGDEPEQVNKSPLDLVTVRG